MPQWLTILLQLFAGLAITVLTAIIVNVISMKTHVATQELVNKSLQLEDARMEATMKESIRDLKETIVKQEQRLEGTLHEMKDSFKALTDELRINRETLLRFVEVVVGIQKQNELLMKRMEDHEERLRDIEKERRRIAAS